MKKYVIYCRVSTKTQGKSGLGLDAQMRDINLYLDNYHNGDYEVLSRFIEVESGKHSNNPELTRAIEVAKSNNAILLVSKLDRLSRKVSFISSLMEDKKLNFKVATMPEATEFQLHIYAALAQQERAFISMRTKAALQSAKERGVKLGGNRGSLDKTNQARKKQSQDNAKQYKAVIKTIQDSGVTSLRGIALKMNEFGHKTAKGGEFQATQIKRIIDKLNCNDTNNDTTKP